MTGRFNLAQVPSTIFGSRPWPKAWLTSLAHRGPVTSLKTAKTRQQDDTRGVVVDVRGKDHDPDDQAEDVHGQAALAARHPLGRIVAGRGGRDPDGRVDTLGVQHHQGRAL